MTVTTDEDIALVVNVGGAPPADVTWTHNEAILQTAGRISIDRTFNRQDVQHNELRISSVQKSDEGRYNMNIKNINGEKTTYCDVTVQGNI